MELRVGSTDLHVRPLHLHAGSVDLHGWVFALTIGCLLLQLSACSYNRALALTAGRLLLLQLGACS